MQQALLTNTEAPASYGEKSSMHKLASSSTYLINKYLIEGVLEKVPLLGKEIKNYKKLNSIARACGFEPGHFYSPIPSRQDLKENADRVFSDSEPLDIKLNIDEQRNLLETFKRLHNDFPYDFINAREDPNLRYRWVNGCQYRYSDVVFLYSFIRHLRPKRIVEVGSGASSAVMLDVNDLFYDSSIETAFIEPYPERLYGFLRNIDREKSTIIEKKVQEVPLEVFLTLEEDDILFVDSSHVVKAGSDVNHIVFEILPRLRKGVCIHFHDIFFPFELPSHWILKYKRFWNESHLLRAFLMNNDSYEIVFFNTLLQKKFRSWFEKEMPECLLDEENTGSIWIRKTC